MMKLALKLAFNESYRFQYIKWKPNITFIVLQLLDTEKNF